MFGEKGRTMKNESSLPFQCNSQQLLLYSSFFVSSLLIMVLQVFCKMFQGSETLASRLRLLNEHRLVSSLLSHIPVELMPYFIEDFQIIPITIREEIFAGRNFWRIVQILVKFLELNSFLNP